MATTLPKPIDNTAITINSCCQLALISPKPSTNKRIANILKKSGVTGGSTVQVDLLQESAEKKLHAEIEKLMPQIQPREAAAALNHTKLYVERARLPAREDEEWYHADLIGLAAFDRDGKTIGAVVAIHNFGAGDLIEVKPDGGDTTVLIPFTRETVPEVDVEGGRLVLAPPEGLFE
jgi:16S rRNA processing protein RimM